MGRLLLILMLGFSSSYVILAAGKNRRIFESTEQVIEHFSGTSSSNASASGVYMALNRLYLDSNWRTGYNNLVLNGDSINVTLEDNNSNPLIPPNHIQINASSKRNDSVATLAVDVFDGQFNGYAVWAKDSITNVITQDSVGVLDAGLQMEYAPFMPEIDYDGLVNEAILQGHVDSSPTFEPPDGYPNGDFYFSGQTPNVIHVQGNLRVKANRTAYGIYIVEGDVILNNNARVEGILYQPASNAIANYGKNMGDTSIIGGILTWGIVHGNGFNIFVQQNPDYMRKFVSGFVPKNPKMRILSWQQP